ncbi:MAG: hypothetical protein ACRC20_00070 [Segniliparus sp.]|uniref:hypothetical protein n=1 Tax=Segniliparus sp. TaxID=2804064 RepID=UPI003F2E6553
MNRAEVIRRGVAAAVLAAALGAAASGQAVADPGGSQAARCAALRKDNQRWVYANDVVEGANGAFQATYQRAIETSRAEDRFWTKDERAHMARVAGPVVDAFADLRPLVRSLLDDVRSFEGPGAGSDLLDAAAEMERQYIDFDRYLGQQVSFLPVFRDWLEQGADPRHMPAGAPDPNGADPEGFANALREFLRLSGCYE